MSRRKGEPDKGTAAPSTTRFNLDVVELLLGLALSAFIVVLNVRYYCHAGGLWRDEVTSVNLASKPSLLDIWQQNHFDSFPILWDTILHGWIYWGPGAADGAVRLLGLLIGLGAVAMYWGSTRSGGVRVPWVLLVVVGLNSTMIVYGSEVRGYGLGVVTELGMLAAWLLFAQRPTWPRGLLAQMTALLCVQALFANCIMVAAAAIGWGLALLESRRWKTIGCFILFSGSAAVSVLPYRRTFAKYGEWFDIVRREVDLAYLTSTFSAALANASLLLVVVWPLLLLATALACLRQIKSREPEVDDTVQLRSWWCLATITLGLILHFCYMKFLKVPTMVWYYLPILALTGFCMDLTLERLIAGKRTARLGRLAVVLVLAVLAGVNAWSETGSRMTRVDLAAAVVQEQARPGDLIVVWPWYTACVFDRYYTGSVPWIALPDFQDKKWQQYPVFREKMFQEDSIRPELERMQATLRAGGRVWLVGGVQMLAQGQHPLELPAGPSPAKRYLWNDLVYSVGWSQQAARLLQSHSELRLVQVAPDVPCRPEENHPLLVAEGWH